MKKDRKQTELRYGYTTGACATAATKAALLALITKEKPSSSTISLPVGQRVTFPIQDCEIHEDFAYATVIKDAGDDPDATHGATIVSTVRFDDEHAFDLDGGFGVGRVTKLGLPVPVGKAAINPIPCKMIKKVVTELIEQFGIASGIKVKISVPEGVMMAEKTLNSRLGIIGGISILGTRGIVVPFSTSAFKASIARAIKVAITDGCDHLVLSTGGRSERYAMDMYPNLKEDAFIEMGDFVGFTLKQCKQKGVQKVTLSGMMGKFSKVAEGVMMVHSKGSSVNFEFLAQVAKEVGAKEPLLEQIRTCNTASQVGTLMEENHDIAFFNHLCEYCCKRSLAHIGGGLEVETIITTLKGKLLGRMSIRG